MSTLKRCISLLLVLGILLSVLAPAAQAAPAEETATVDTDAMTIKGTNGFGNLLSQEITESQEEAEAAGAEYPGGYTVTDLVIEGTTATVTYDTMEEATLVVALYTEDGMQMLTSATATVAPDATEAELAFEGEMPEYFLASAYLLDSYDLSPLCAAYDTPMYTREMQELLASTVNDYDPEKVLNLDEDETTNFAVYADSTIVIEAEEGINTVASIDDENLTYVIKNANEQITSLVEGNVFVYPYAENEILIAKIDTITVAGTTVTITSAELEVEEVFAYTKIEGQSKNAEISVDDSTAGEGISYVGLVEDENGTLGPQNVEGGNTKKYYHKFELNIGSHADSGQTSASLSVTGTLELDLTVSLNYYLSTSRRYISFTTTSEINFDLGVHDELVLYEHLGHFSIPVAPGVKAGFEPELQLRFEGEMDLKVTLAAVVGFQYDNGSGFQNLSQKPTIDLKMDVEGSIFLGVDLCPQIELIDDSVAEIEANILVGVELKATACGTMYEFYDSDSSEKHLCRECLDLDAIFKVKIGGSLRFLEQDWLTVGITIGEVSYPLGSMYYSLDNKEFGFGACPNKLFRVTVQVKDKEYHPIPGETVTVSTLEEALTTDENGLVVFYTPEDEIVVRAEKDGYFSVERVIINKARKIVLSLIYQLDGGDDGGSAGSSEPGNPFEGIDFGGVEGDDFVDHDTAEASGTCGSDVFWELLSSGLLVIRGTGAMTNFRYSTDVPWYSCRSQIKRVQIADGVTSIGVCAFKYCDNLTGVSIPDSITSIGYSAFADCDSLTSVIIPDSVTFIDSYAFSRCNNLTSMIISDSITSIGFSVFSSCTNLTSVTIPDGVTSIGDSAFAACSSLTSVTIPDSVTLIDDSAFYKCASLTNVTIPGSVTSIGESAFANCDSLTSVTIPDSVTFIGNCAFGECGCLSEILVDADNAFYSHDDHGILFNKDKTVLLQAPGGITGVYAIPNTVTSIDRYAFAACSSLTSVTIPDGVTSIGSSAFLNCDSLTSVTIPNSVTSIGSDAFTSCDCLTEILVHAGNAFYSHDDHGILFNKDKTVLMKAPGGITGTYTIPNSVTSIRIGAFHECFSLTSVTIPSSVTFIDISAFWKCASLTSVVFSGDAPVILSNVFSYVTATAYYPADNLTWTANMRKDYGGDITWVPYTPGEELPGTGMSAEPMALMDSALELGTNAIYPGDYGTEITDEYTLKNATFSGLVPGQQYVLLAMVSIEFENPLVADNLLFVDQGTALEDGTLRFTYVQREFHDTSYVVVCGASSKNLNDAKIAFPDMIADGELQVVDPVVAYDGVTLTEGQDYVIAGKVDFTEAGEYTCYIRGIHNYAGLVECTYTVAEHEHSFTNYVSDGNATCTEDGTKTAKCDHCDATDTIPDIGSALGHDMGSWETTVPATCTENGEEQRTCSRCDHSESRVIESVGHRWDKGVVTREPTEDTEGERLYTCTACGATKTEPIPVIGHEHRYEAVVTAPTCTERGYTTYTCKCGESYVADYVDALGHSFGEWIVIQEPTTTEDGLEERSCSRCGHIEQRTVAKLENPFNDVAPGSFYYEPVMWAIENSITNGTSATTFGPNDQCMRAHVVTFLWRAVGSPEPTRTDNPFVDVKPGDFYYKPVLWALENGITSGMDAIHFGPTSYCNRAQVVTFLYRTMGSPELESAENPFTDVAKGSFYEKPVLWAVQNGITNGLSATTFGPNAICNRAQIVTFLYRAFVND